jgi:hypothetical protein
LERDQQIGCCKGGFDECCVQHALGVMRTPRIKRLVLELDIKENQQLTAVVESESGTLLSPQTGCTPKSGISKW